MSPNASRSTDLNRGGTKDVVLQCTPSTSPHLSSYQAVRRQVDIVCQPFGPQTPSNYAKDLHAQ